MKRNLIPIMAVTAVLLCSCTMAPKYERPAAPVPDAWPAGTAYKEAKPATGAPLAAEIPWRDFFSDARLQKVIAMALENNRDLRVAALNVEKTRALYGIQRAELLPVIGATGSGSRTRVPADLSTTGTAGTMSQYSVNLGVSSWEIDFFGRIRSLKDQVWEEYQATDQDRRSAQILLVSTIANTYLTLAADRENLKLVTATLEAQQSSYTLIKKRYDVGLATELGLKRAQSQVDTAARDVALYAQFAAQDENALALLVGATVPLELLPTEMAAIAPLREIAPGLKSDQLLNRPDVLAAEHRLKAANANIGAARAAFFPRISLTTAIGTASVELAGLFRAGQDTWTFAPQISVPIFDARTWYAYDATKVDRQIAVAQYEKAVQSAFRDVADALAVRGTVERQIAAQQSLVDALAETYRLSDARYTKGIDNYLSVLDAQRSLYGAQQGLISLKLARIANLVTLYKVLGGGE